MRLENRLELPTPPDELFAVLLDVERIAPCMPGATLTEQDGDRYGGKLKVKVGPISAQYQGTVEFVEIDRAQRRVVLNASGKETRGQGGAEATVTAHIRESGGGSVLELVTDLQISGKVAQFGRGVLGDVSQGLIQTFAQNLQASVLTPSGERDGGPTPAPVGTELDALRMVALPVLRRAWPAIAALALLAVWILRRRDGDR